MSTPTPAPSRHPTVSLADLETALVAASEQLERDFTEENYLAQQRLLKRVLEARRMARDTLKLPTK